MKIGICLKSTPSTDARITINDSRNGVDTSAVRWIISPYDELALEEGAKTIEQHTGELTVFTVGGNTKNIREALSKGADGAVRITDDAMANADSLGVAKALAAAIKANGSELIFCGKVAIDDQNAQVPAMIAELLGWPHISVVTEFEYNGSEITAARAIGGGVTEVVKCPLPAVITTERGLNTPRYAKLPQIMKAKKKPLIDISLADLGLSADDVNSALSHSNFEPPPARTAGKILDGDASHAAAEVIRLLREEAKVL